jgi:predicted RNA-binding Zn-ribbon protein involved in translation (DUF1610 family)
MGCEAVLPEHTHIERHPCPECRSLRAIQTEKTERKETLYCPDCGHNLDRNVLPERPA